MGRESVLVNFVYCHPVGHAVEALQYCLGYRCADPDRRIGVVLNSATPAELATWCGAVDEVYTVDIDVFRPPTAEALAHIPADWDWVVDDPRGHQKWQHDFFPGLQRYYELSAEHFRTTGGHTRVGAPEPSYRPRNPLRLELPDSAHSWADDLLPPHDAPTIAVLPGGSAERWRYPSLASWQRILGAIAARWPKARVCLTGKLADDGRTSTGFTRAEFDALAATVPDVVWALDVPLDRQLAAMRRCDLLLSPHTGFAFAALAVGTPWLALAGNDWAEYYFNPGVPFYSVLPDLARFPCYVLLGNTPEPVDDDGPRSPSMSAGRIDADLAELIDGAAWLLGGEADFDTAMREHANRVHVLFQGRTELMYSIDDLLTSYLP
ncbi:glycosyltransferase family 9 protein [Saccharopolyspora sp. 5N708]|uniref:glycosyltransferase family 9 protein n=1 Tax=Saccharopolyspora sp. 5N708 TaxID=3457424 RepID=UPI003FD458B8